MNKAPTELTAVQAAALMESGALTAEALARACLDRIAERDGEVRAYLACDPDRVLAEARAVDRGHRGGLLRGIPYAVKDVIETVDYPTTYGSPIYQGYRTGRDAGVVACAAEQGAVLMGKVATGEFATQTPGPARNPLNTAHTPGGSSSGSAAAVAAGMALAALGTQTTGSLIRPAVYCGLVGYKPSFGVLSTAGVGTLSPMQDTVGLITRDVADAALFMGGLHGWRITLERMDRPRIGVCRSSQWQWARPQTVQAIEALASRLSAAGAQVRDVVLPAELEALVDVQAGIVAYDARQSLGHERLRHYDRLSQRLRDRIHGGAATILPDYLSMVRQVACARARILDFMADWDVLLYPATEGEAEVGIEYSGSPRFGALWTLLHMPSVSFPTTTGPTGLPLGAQVVGACGDDLRTLAVAQFVAAVQQAGQVSA